MSSSTIAALVAEARFLSRAGMLVSPIFLAEIRARFPPIGSSAVLSQSSFAQTFSATLKFYRSDCGTWVENRRKTSLTMDRRLLSFIRAVWAGEERSRNHFFSLKIQ